MKIMRTDHATRDDGPPRADMDESATGCGPVKTFFRNPTVLSEVSKSLKRTRVDLPEFIRPCEKQNYIGNATCAKEGKNLTVVRSRAGADSSAATAIPMPEHPIPLPQMGYPGPEENCPECGAPNDPSHGTGANDDVLRRVRLPTVARRSSSAAARM